MKLFVKTHGKVIGPLEWERILLAEEKGRFSPDVLVSEDKVNWVTIGVVKQNLSTPTGYTQYSNSAGYNQPQVNIGSIKPLPIYPNEFGDNDREKRSKNLLFIVGMVALVVFVFILIAVVVGICLIF